MKRLIGLGLSVVMCLLVVSPVAADATINTVRDCDDNAVISCGAASASELQSKYMSNFNVALIYEYFGITMNDMKAITTTAQVGSVNTAGEVKVGSTTVATNAITAGRQNIAGSTQITYKNVTFYQRTPSVSFAQSSLPAYVVMKNGSFAFAIIASCGNPVKATSVPKPSKPQPIVQTVTPPASTPTPPAPQPTPPVVVEQAPPQQAAPPTELVPTGAHTAAVAGVFGTSSILAGAASYIYRVRRLRGGISS